MKSLLIAVLAVVGAAAHAQSFVAQHPCGFESPGASWSPDCQRYFSNLHGQQIDSAIEPPWSIELVTIRKNALNLIGDPSTGVRADLETHLPDCLRFDIAAVRWISSHRLLITAQPMSCADSPKPAALVYTVDVTTGEIVRYPNGHSIAK